MKPIRDLLEESPFFEVFETAHINRLAENCRIESFREGQNIFTEHSPAKAFYMLIDGDVRLSLHRPAQSREEKETKRNTKENLITVRKINEPGRCIGWCSMVEPYHHQLTATAVSQSSLLSFDKNFLDNYCREDPGFGYTFMNRIVWELGNRLRTARIRIISQRYDREIHAIRALLDQYAETIHVTSPLHKIPHYLENRLTVSDAFHCLELLRIDGDEQERNLASLCLEILENIKKEFHIFHQLQSIYEHVANAPDRMAPERIRKLCCEDFIKLYEQTNYVVRGMENLPKETGHIYIMNHLKNHMINLLPNDFILTLDTHFVSSMIIYKKYGQPPIRVVRKSHPDEYGHQRYFDRLGYIYVYAKHVDESEKEPRSIAQERLQNFLETARNYLLSGMNIVICPEGSCTETENSPLPFRSGVFRLALFVKPEPLIVPVAVANFDKKLMHTKTAAIIHKPFYLSQKIQPPVTDKSLFDFINSYHETYRQYVQEVRQLADN